jgi:hypothetical protein
MVSISSSRLVNAAHIFAYERKRIDVEASDKVYRDMIVTYLNQTIIGLRNAEKASTVSSVLSGPAR